MPTLFLSPMLLWCCGLRCPWRWRTAAAPCFLGVCDCSGCPPLSCSADWGELCFSSGTCGWLTRLLLSVRWPGGLWCWRLSGQWSRVGNACGLWFIRLLDRGLLCSRPIPKLPPPFGLPCMIWPSMIGQSQQRSEMKSALIILSCLLTSRFPFARAWQLNFPISIDGMLFPCLAWQALYSTLVRGS
jgi:hypothetical protein